MKRRGYYFKKLLLSSMGFMFILLLCGLHTSASSSPLVEGKHDLTHEIIFELNKVYLYDQNPDQPKENIIENKGAIPRYNRDRQATVRVGDRLRLEYSWRIENKNIDELKQSYFQFQLPDTSILKSEEGVFAITEEKSGSIIGDCYIDSFGLMTIVFSETQDLSKTQALENGIIRLNMVAQKTTDGVSISTGQSTHTEILIKISKKSTDNIISQNSFDRDFTTPLIPKEVIFNGIYPNARKKSVSTFQVNSSDKVISYSIELNGEQVPNMMSRSVQIKDNFFVSDLLPEGLEIDSETLKFCVPIYVPLLEEKFGKYYLKNTFSDKMINHLNHGKILPNFNDYFHVENYYGDETWDKFVNRIKSGSSYTIGIWNNRGIAANFGTVPLINISYNNLIDGDSFENYVNGSNMNMQQKQKVLEIYHNQPIVNFSLDFKAKIKVRSHSSYITKAILYQDGVQKASSSAKVDFSGVSASVDQVKFNGKISVTKKWVDKETSHIPVLVNLYEGDIKLESKELSESSTVIFEGLDDKKVYWIKEEEATIPVGYRSYIAPAVNYYEIQNIKLMPFSVRFEFKDKKGTALASGSNLLPDEAIKATLMKKIGQESIQVGHYAHTFPIEGGEYTFEKVDQYRLSGNQVLPIEYDVDFSVPKDFTVDKKFVQAENIYVVTLTSIKEEQVSQGSNTANQSSSNNGGSTTSPNSGTTSPQGNPDSSQDYSTTQTPKSGESSPQNTGNHSSQGSGTPSLSQSGDTNDTNSFVAKVGVEVPAPVPAPPIVENNKEENKQTSAYKGIATIPYLLVPMEIHNPSNQVGVETPPVPPVISDLFDTEGKFVNAERDEIPLGDLDIELLEEDTPLGYSKIKEENSEKGIAKDGEKSSLAVTGGLLVKFLPYLIVFLLLIASFVALEWYRKKRK